jgi:hypothetical protein
MADRKDGGPRVLECGPSEGPAGTTVRVVLQTFPSNPALKLAFGGLVVDTKQLDNANFTNLAAIVPMPNQTHSVNNAPQIPISVCVYENDAVHNSWVIGEFTYTEGTVFLLNAPSSPLPKNIPVGRKFNFPAVEIFLEATNPVFRIGINNSSFPKLLLFLQVKPTKMIVKDSMARIPLWPTSECMVNMRLF